MKLTTWKTVFQRLSIIQQQREQKKQHPCNLSNNVNNNVPKTCNNENLKRTAAKKTVVLLIWRSIYYRNNRF